MTRRRYGFDVGPYKDVWGPFGLMSQYLEALEAKQPRKTQKDAAIQRKKNRDEDRKYVAEELLPLLLPLLQKAPNQSWINRELLTRHSAVVKHLREYLRDGKPLSEATFLKYYVTPLCRALQKSAGTASAPAQSPED